MVKNNILEFELKDVKNDSVKKFSLLKEAPTTNLTSLVSKTMT